MPPNINTKQEYKMKKVLKLTASFAIGAAIGIAGVCIGIYIASGKPIGSTLEKIADINIGMILAIFAFLLLAIFLHVILHEGGHLVCGLATGYKFVSFRILNLTFIRQNGKLRVKRFGIAGTGGQCLLTPPDRPLQDIPTVLYNLGGVLANLLTSAIAIVLLLATDDMPRLVDIFLIMFSVSGIFVALMNGIPMKMGGIGNDADNMRLLLKDKRSKQALVIQLRVNALVQEGVRPKDMPQEWFLRQEETDYRDALQATVRLMAATLPLDREDWETAHSELEEVLTHKKELIGLLALEAECELLFTSLVTGRSQRAEALYTKELEEYIRQYKKVMSSKQRQLCALALYREKDVAKAKEIYETVRRQREKYLMQGEVESDIALMKSILTTANVL